MLDFLKDNREPLVVGGKEFPKVVWYKHSSLVHLHLLVGVLMLSSATNGFDGSMSMLGTSSRVQS
jgi:hypothetical protein